MTCLPTFFKKKLLNLFMEFSLGFSIWAKGGNCPPFHGKVVAEGVFKDGKHVQYFPGPPGFLSKFPKKLTLIFQSLEPSLLLMKSGSYSWFCRCECQNSDMKMGGGLMPWCLWGFLLFSTACGKPNFGDWQLGICSFGKVQSKNEKKHHESRMETPSSLFGLLCFVSFSLFF